MVVVLLIMAISISVFALFNKVIKRVFIIVLVRCLMLGLNGILHMGSNDKFDRIIDLKTSTFKNPFNKKKSFD